MKILSVPLARAVWIFDLARVNSKGRSLLDTMAALGARYRFAAFPKTLMDVNADNALQFTAGTFIKDGTDFRVGLVLYSNGVWGDSFASTETSEAFLEDVAAWLASQQGIDIKPEVKIRGYVNQMHVQMEHSLSLWNPRLDFVRERMDQIGTSADGVPRRYEMEGIMLHPHDAGQSMAPYGFQIDRKWGTKPEENIYYSQASTSTEKHVTLLNEIEKTLATR